MRAEARSKKKHLRKILSIFDEKAGIMKTIQIELPEDVVQQLVMMGENRQDFILEAIREKIKKRERLNNTLREGYQASYQEDLELANDFELTDLENWK